MKSKAKKNTQKIAKKTVKKISKETAKPVAKMSSAKKASAKKVEKKVAPKTAAPKKSTAKKAPAKSAGKSEKSGVKSSAVKKSASQKPAEIAKAVSAAAIAPKAGVVGMVKSAAKAVTSAFLPKKSTPESDTLAVGSVAPDFRLPIETGKEVSLKDYAGKTVVLYFYPKDDTPGCTQESCDFRDSFSRVQAKGAVVLGVSKDSIKSHVKFKEKFGLPFSLISDESGKMLEAYRVWKEKSMYGRKYMGIDRTTYLIDVDAKGNGKIRKSYSKVKVEGHVDEILKDLN